MFKLKHSVLLSALDRVNEKLDRLEKVDGIEKVVHSKWAVPAVYVNNKKKFVFVLIFRPG